MEVKLAIKEEPEDYLFWDDCVDCGEVICIKGRKLYAILDRLDKLAERIEEMEFKVEKTREQKTNAGSARPRN